MRHILPIALLAFATPVAAQSPAQPFTVQGGQGFAKLDEALMAIRGQDATILIAPGTYHECAIQQAGHIVFKASAPGRVIFEQTTCEGKAALVLRGRGHVARYWRGSPSGAMGSLPDGRPSCRTMQAN